MAGWSYQYPWKVITQVLKNFLLYIRLTVRNRERICFWEDSLERSTFKFTICWYLKSYYSENSYHLKGPCNSSSWNLNFQHNLINLEIKLLGRFTLSPNSVQSLLAQGLVFSSILSFSVKSFLWSCPNLLTQLFSFLSIILEIKSPIRGQRLSATRGE